jgi:hypothetical protein
LIEAAQRAGERTHSDDIHTWRVRDNAPRGFVQDVQGDRTRGAAY